MSACDSAYLISMVGGDKKMAKQRSALAYRFQEFCGGQCLLIDLERNVDSDEHLQNQW